MQIIFNPNDRRKSAIGRTRFSKSGTLPALPDATSLSQIFKKDELEREWNSSGRWRSEGQSHNELPGRCEGKNLWPAMRFELMTSSYPSKTVLIRVKRSATELYGL